MFYYYNYYIYFITFDILKIVLKYHSYLIIYGAVCHFFVCYG